MLSHVGSFLQCMLLSSLHLRVLQIQAHRLQPALQWAEQHRSQLAATVSGAAFEFKLHRLQFLHVLNQQGTTS